MSGVKSQLFTYANFDNLLNKRNQAGQVFCLTYSKNIPCPLLWNSSKIKRELHSTIAAETLSLLEGCDV